MKYINLSSSLVLESVSKKNIRLRRTLRKNQYKLEESIKFPIYFTFVIGSSVVTARPVSLNIYEALA